MRTSTRRLPIFLLGSLVSLSGCSSNKPHSTQTLSQARAGFTTHLTKQNKTTDPVPNPPPELFSVVQYPAPLGAYPAYLSRPPSTFGKYPAIIWIAGGFDNGIGDTPWAPATSDNDQSASAFRKAGIITMYPSLRGGNNNPGYMEGFYGEVDDILAAEKYLASLSYVDPHRIYLGGHSTGGTLALLVAESTNQFRAVFSFGPVGDTVDYGSDDMPIDLNDNKETELRAPILWLHAITCPTYVIEGTEKPSNIDPLHEMQSASQNPQLHFLEVRGLDHFSELAKTTPTVARKIAQDTGPTVNISLPQSDL